MRWPLLEQPHFPIKNETLFYRASRAGRQSLPASPETRPIVGREESL